MRVLDAPVFQDHAYRVDREIVGLSQSRRPESFWMLSTLHDSESGVVVARVLLHSGFFKTSYPGYPADQLR